MVKKYDTIKNNSKVYFTNSIWVGSKCGKFKIIGRSNKKDSQGFRGYYLCKFEDGTVIIAHTSSIKYGSIKNPNQPNVYGVGFIGQGLYSLKEYNREYALWKSLMQRCYDLKFHKDHPTYKECTVDKRWHNFQNFCKDIKMVENYNLWLDRKNRMQLDKDIKIKDNKVYSKNFCKFVTNKENNQLCNKNQPTTGFIYIATRISDGYTEEFEVQKNFAIKYNLHLSNLNRCIKGAGKTHKGWKFEIKK